MIYFNDYFVLVMSGIEKKAPINGKGKEYILNTNKIIFEGEYINKKRSGKGIEYDEYGYVKFKGEYLNGKKNGKGKEYYNNDLIFEGEYADGKKTGKGLNIMIIIKLNLKENIN